MSGLSDKYICSSCGATFPRADLPECPMCEGVRLVEFPKVGDAVMVLTGHNKNRKGTVLAYRKDGRLKVKLGDSWYAMVRPENLRVIRRGDGGQESDN